MAPSVDNYKVIAQLVIMQVVNDPENSANHYFELIFCLHKFREPSLRLQSYCVAIQVHICVQTIQISLQSWLTLVDPLHCNQFVISKQQVVLLANMKVQMVD